MQHLAVRIARLPRSLKSFPLREGRSTVFNPYVAARCFHDDVPSVQGDLNKAIINLGSLTSIVTELNELDENKRLRYTKATKSILELSKFMVDLSETDVVKKSQTQVLEELVEKKFEDVTLRIEEKFEELIEEKFKDVTLRIEEKFKELIEKKFEDVNLRIEEKFKDVTLRTEELKESSSEEDSYTSDSYTSYTDESSEEDNEEEGPSKREFADSMHTVGNLLTEQKNDVNLGKKNDVKLAENMQQLTTLISELDKVLARGRI